MERNSRSGGQGKNSLGRADAGAEPGTMRPIVEEELDEALGAGSSERVWAKNGLGIGTAVART